MDPKPLRIFTFHDSPRLRYVAGILLGEILGLQWEITSDKRKLKKCPVINYSDENLEGAYRIMPDGLLNEKGIYPKEIKVITWKGLPVFFTGDSPDIPFDIFSASFFLISRYEEYLDHQPDNHGRFRSSSSIASRYGFLGIPVVDLWTREMAKGLLKKFRTLTFRRNEFRSEVIIDSDHTFSNGSGNLINTIENIAGRFSGKQRKNIAIDYIPDSFSYLLKTAGQNRSGLRFFFPVGDHSKYDKNPSWKNNAYRALISQISAKSETGLYSSYYVHEKKLIGDEAGRLEKILGNKLNSNRFHSQRFFHPHSFRMLLKEGIMEDFSMGYPENPGFRAGIARSYYFYDLPEEKQTSLRLFPFVFSDGTLLQQGMSIEEAAKAMQDLIDIIRNVGGLFISSWHTHVFDNNGPGVQIRKMFEQMIQYQEHDSIS